MSSDDDLSVFWRHPGVFCSVLSGVFAASAGLLTKVAFDDAKVEVICGYVFAAYFAYETVS